MGLTVEFVRTYFLEEKTESIFFILIGLASLILAILFLYVIKYSFYKGLAIPLLIVGIIQLTVGFNVLLKTDLKIERAEDSVLQQNKEKNNEIKRINIVMKNFKIYKWIEILLILLGLILFFYVHSGNQIFWKGIGLGLLIQGSLMLSLDLLAEKRSEVYLTKLNELIENPVIQK